MSYRPDRVKSSIPKANVDTKSKQKTTTQSDGKYLEELKKQEIQRSLKIRDDELIQ